MACITPFTKWDDVNLCWQAFPCGKCPECLKRRVSGWSFRLLQEGKRCRSSHFVTLTYDTRHVPITPKGFMNLQRGDVQKFCKRLRYYLPDHPIRYYAAGEYGSQNWRPHYHLILFNAEPKAILKAWSLDNQQLGDVHFGEVTGASIGYCLKYMMKPSRIPLHKNDDRIKEFSLMSKGLGSNYITEDMNRWHLEDLENRMLCMLEDGRKIAMPRYYKDRIYSDEERKAIAHFARQEAERVKLEDEIKMVKLYGDNWMLKKSQFDILSFKKMYSDAEKNRNL